MSNSQVQTIAEQAGRLAADFYQSRNTNCAGSVLKAINQRCQAGLPEELVAPITCNLGGGLASGETCGALLGAEIALGLCMRRDGHTFDKKEQHEAAGNLLAAFKAVCGGLNCRDLKTGDPATPDSHVPNCAKIVSQAAQLALKELHKWRPDFF